MEAIKIVYDDVEVTYNEGSNEWEFELRGRSRSAASLKLAKEAIDAPAPKPKNPFKRFKAYQKSSFGYEFIEVEVTSVAENGLRGRLEVWVAGGRRQREKVEAADLVAVNAANNSTIEKIRALESEIKSLKQEQHKLEKSLSGITELLGDAANA